MEFLDNHEKFIVLGVCHVKYVTVFFGVAGILATLAIFGFGVTIFPWSLYENTVNAAAIIAFACFLIGGCTVHFLMLHAVQQTRFRYMIPAIFYQTFLMCLNGVTSLIAVGELVSEGTLSPRDEKMAKIVLCTCPSIFMIQVVMLAIIGKCRYYIQCKRRHIRNGLPPPVREVIRFSQPNKVSSMENSVETGSIQLAETMMPGDSSRS